MNGGMRIDAKQLPLRHQEQVAVAILAQIAMREGETVCQTAGIC